MECSSAATPLCGRAGGCGGRESRWSTNFGQGIDAVFTVLKRFHKRLLDGCKGTRIAEIPECHDRPVSYFRGWILQCLNDRREGAFVPEMLKCLDRIAAHKGVGIVHRLRSGWGTSKAKSCTTSSARPRT